MNIYENSKPKHDTVGFEKHSSCGISGQPPSTEPEGKKGRFNYSLRKFDVFITLALLVVVGSVIGAYVLVLNTKLTNNLDLGELEFEQLALELKQRLNVTEGPRGLPGPRGEKGDAAKQCECDAEIELRNALQQAQGRLFRVEAALNPKTCRDVATRYLNDTGGVFTIYPLTGGRQGIKVFCDFVTDGGGWLVFQRRKDGSENFNRGWVDYVNGFGKLDGEFWLGLEKLHLITNSGDFEMRVDMEDFERNKTYAFYGNFSVGRGSDYAMTHAHFSGPAGNGLTTTGARFSTKDKDQDTKPKNCAASYKGGWWFTACHNGNPNGYYHGGPHDSYADGVCWKPFRGFYYSLKIMELKIRRK